MNIVVNSQLLAAELRLLNKIVPSKPAIPILSHALLRADEGLHIWATDLEVSLNAPCRANVIEPGLLALPVAKLLALVEQFPDGDVSISGEKGRASIACGAFKSKLQVLPADDMPAQPVAVGSASMLDADVLRSLISKTRYAISSATASKYVLQGALLMLDGRAAVMVATDGKRLALATASCSGAAGRTIIPMKTLDVVAGQPGGGDVELTIGERHLFFSIGGRTLASRTNDDKFPAYERVIPRGNDKIIVMPRAALASALRRVILTSDEKGATYFDVAPGKLELSSASAEIGSASEPLCVGYEGPPLKILSLIHI